MHSIVAVDSTLLHDIFEYAQMFVTFCIALRALYLYIKVRNPRLFVLWLALSMFTLTSIIGLSGDHHLFFLRNTNWFKYIGQSVSLFFIWLSALRPSEHYLRQVRNWHIFSSVLLIGLMLITPWLPAFPNPWTQVVVSSLRAVISMLIFFQYVGFYITKPTRFSMLMCIAFLLLSFGAFIIFPKFLLSQQDVLSNTGDIMRICGLVFLLVAYLVG